MTHRPVLPDEEEQRAFFVPRFKAELKAKERKLWQLSGLEREYGPYERFAGTFEMREMTSEITIFLFCTILLHVEDRRRSNRGVGRPRDLMTPELGPLLLDFFLRCHKTAGRHSVAISNDGKQQEDGPLFRFIQLAIEPLNRYLIEINQKPLSAARLARFALHHHRCKPRRPKSGEVGIAT